MSAVLYTCLFKYSYLYLFAISISLGGVLFVFLVNLFVNTALFPTKKKYSTRALSPSACARN